MTTLLTTDDNDGLNFMEAVTYRALNGERGI